MNVHKLEISHVVNEIKDLQYDIKRWVRGTVPQDYEIISKRQALDMTVINSKGHYESRNQFNNRYQKYYGKYEDAEFSVEIVRTKRLTDDMIMASYHQTSNISGEEQERMSTAVFKYNPEKKNNAEWCHVHTTLIQ